MTNYRESYECAECHARGVKLWRDYQTVADACRLRCAGCASAAVRDRGTSGQRGPLDDDGVFTFAFGDQLGWLVPAVPTDDGETFWGYTSVPAAGVAWWHSLPTYVDDAIEQRCLVNLLRRAVAGLTAWPSMIDRSRREASVLATRLGVAPPPASPARLGRAGRGDGSVAALRAALLATYQGSAAAHEEYQAAIALEDDLRWKTRRSLYVFNRPHTLTVWGTVTAPFGEDRVIRYAAEVPREAKVGARIATIPDSDEARLLDEEDSYAATWVIFDRDGAALIRKLLEDGVIQRAAAEIH